MKSQVRPSLVLASLLAIILMSGIESLPTPPNSDCSSIVPISNTDTICDSMNNTIARDIRDNTIIPKLERIQATMTAIFDHSSLADIGDEELTYNTWRDDGSRQLITVGETPENTIDRSVNRFKCMVVAVADIVANESIRYLVDEEEPHFASEFQSVLGDLDVLLDIEAVLFGAGLIPCDTSLRSATCAHYCALERDVQIKSVAFELKSFPAEIKETFNDHRLSQF